VIDHALVDPAIGQDAQQVVAQQLAAFVVNRRATIPRNPEAGIDASR